MFVARFVALYIV